MSRRPASLEERLARKEQARRELHDRYRRELVPGTRTKGN